MYDLRCSGTGEVSVIQSCGMHFVKLSTGTRGFFYGILVVE